MQNKKFLSPTLCEIRNEQLSLPTCSAAGHLLHFIYNYHKKLILQWNYFYFSWSHCWFEKKWSSIQVLQIKYEGDSEGHMDTSQDKALSLELSELSRKRLIQLSFHQQPDDDINQEHYCYRDNERIRFHGLQPAIYPLTGRYRRGYIPRALAFLPGKHFSHGISGGERG